MREHNTHLIHTEITAVLAVRGLCHVTVSSMPVWR